MKKQMIPFLLGGILALAVIASGVSGGSEVYSILSDAFFVPGVLLSGIGMIIRVSNAGVFDMLAFGVSDIARIFTGKEQDSYYDYKKKRHGNPSRESGLLLAGGVYLCLAVIFFLLWRV